MSEFDEEAGVHNSLLDLEIVIDRPVGQVWAQMMDVGSWVTSHLVEEVAGSRGTLGSITRVSFRRAKELKMPLAHYHFCKIIKIVPLKQYVLKAYSEKGGSYGVEIIGFDDTRLEDLNGSTKIQFRAFGDIRGELMIRDPSGMQAAEEDDHMLKNLQNLKGILEEQPRWRG